MIKQKKVVSRASGKTSQTSKKKSSKKDIRRQETNPQKPAPSYIIGIGASAGGLEATIRLLSHLAENSGAAVVLIQHLDPTHPSLTPEILSRNTSIPVLEVTAGMLVRADHIYVIPPNCNMSLTHGALNLSVRSEVRGRHMPIDFFFQSLARDQKSRAIGIVLSGVASDGTLGLESIKSEGGLTIAQEPTSAKHDGMPQSAISSGVVDLIHTPEGIAKELMRIVTHPSFGVEFQVNSPDEKLNIFNSEKAMNKIFELLLRKTNTNFSHYKKNTIQRRILRRLLVLNLDDLHAYATHLETHPEEVELLFSEILIHVTSFFRDPKAFEILKQQILHQYTKQKEFKGPFRIWIAGCSTGEEAYSIAISFLEFLENSGLKATLNIFATDLSEFALRKARRALYPKSIEADVSPERRKKYFEKVDGGYRVSKLVRDICVFCKHDLISDPPFAKVDMISCRNLLIYFATPLQKHVLPIFHYALLPGGILWLGGSETVGDFSTLFAPSDKANKFYFKKNVTLMAKFQFPKNRYSVDNSDFNRKSAQVAENRYEVQKELDRAASSEYAPPGVLINDTMEILHARGSTAPYLELSPGQASLNLMKMVRPEIAAELRQIIQVAKKKSVAVKREGLSFDVKGKTLYFNINVIPMSPSPMTTERRFSVFFEELLHYPKPTKKANLSPKNKAAAINRKAIETELKHSADLEYQQSLIEEYDTAQEELTSSNEELQSTNEEMQSTNEELETAKEELQAVNEELTTVNDELTTRNEELRKVYADASTVFQTTPIPLIVIGPEKRIQKANELFYHNFQVKADETEGKLLLELSGGSWNSPQLSHLIDVTLASGKQFHNFELEQCFPKIGCRSLILNSARVFLQGSQLDAIVLAIDDCTERKGIEVKLRLAEDRYRNLLTSAHEGILIVNSNGLIEFANKRVEALFGYKDGKLTNLHLETLVPGKFTQIFKNRDARSLLKNFSLKADGMDIDLQGKRKDKTLFPIDVSLSSIDSGNETFVTIIIRDASDRKRLAEKTARLLEVETEARASADQANRLKDEFLATLSHELRTPLTSILARAQMIQRMKEIDPAQLAKLADAIVQSARIQKHLINDLLDISRIQSGKLSVKLTQLIPSDPVLIAVEIIRPMADIKSIQIETEISPNIGIVMADTARVQQIVCNLLTNAIKFSSDQSTIRVQVENLSLQEKDYVSIKVTDQGKGILPEFLPRLFNKFSQADSSSTRVHAGLGLGLAIVDDLVKMHGGFIEAKSDGKMKGSTFIVYLPFASLPAVDNERPDEVSTRFPTLHENQLSAISKLTGIRVLIVDDEHSSLSAMTEMLNSFGATTLPAGSASEALAILDKIQPDILLCDLAMPKEDGYSLLRQIRKRESGQANQLIAVAFTAYASEGDIKRALAAGFVSHLAKPVEADVLINLVSDLTQKR